MKIIILLTILVALGAISGQNEITTDGNDTTTVETTSTSSPTTLTSANETKMTTNTAMSHLPIEVTFILCLFFLIGYTFA